MVGYVAAIERNQVKVFTCEYDKHICACMRAAPTVWEGPLWTKQPHQYPLSQWGSEMRQRSVRRNGLRPAGAPCLPTRDSLPDTAALYKQPLTHLHASLKPPQVWISQPRLTKHEYPAENMMKAARYKGGWFMMQSPMFIYVSGNSTQSLTLFKWNLRIFT